jgi:hypothetical protein
MTGLNFRVGIEGFFFIVRTSSDFHMKPQFFYTSEALSDYMKIAVRKRWDNVEIGTKLEAFAIAGSNVLSMYYPIKRIA